MFNRKQVELIPKNLGLSYRWIYPAKGTSSIIVEEAIEFKPFSNWLTDLRTNQRYHSDTVNKYKKFCKELSDLK